MATVRVVLTSFDDFPIHQASVPVAHSATGRPQPLRPLLLQRLLARRRPVLRRGDGAVPEPPRRRCCVLRGARTAADQRVPHRSGHRSTAATPPRSAASSSRSSSRCRCCASSVDAPEQGLRADLTFDVPVPGHRGGALLPARRRAHVVRLHPPHPVRRVERLDRARRRAHRGDARRRVGITRPVVGRAPGRRTRPDRRPGAGSRSSSGCGRR